jgi:succinyl-CoA synthetase beta subunit
MVSPERKTRNLSEAAVYRLLDEVGIRVVAHRMAESVDEAARLAARIGFPVVCKISAAGILHKSSLGGVETDLRTPGEVKAAFTRITSGIQRRAPEAAIDGCLLMAQAPRGLAEVIAGTARDAEFGRVIMFGAGGEFAEVLKCVDFRSLPVGVDQVSSMVAKVRRRMTAAAGWRRLDPAVPAELIRRLGDLLGAHPEIESLDINPAIVYQSTYLVVDAKGVVAEPE